MFLHRMKSTEEEYYAPLISLYEANFAYPERHDAQEQKRILRCDCYYCCAVMDPMPVGLAFFWETDDFLYLEHLCVDPVYRQRGYGSQILDLLKARGKQIILEIEPVVDTVTQKRRAFYERNGFVKNPYPHLQPKYHYEDADLPLWIFTSEGEIDPKRYEDFHAFLIENVQIPPKRKG